MRVATHDRVRDRPLYGRLVVPSGWTCGLAALLQVMTDFGCSRPPERSVMVALLTSGRESVSGAWVMPPSRPAAGVVLGGISLRSARWVRVAATDLWPWHAARARSA